MEVPGCGHGDNLHSLLIKSMRIKLNFVRDDDYGRLFASVRIQAECAWAAGDDQADITIANFVAAASLDHCGHQIGMGHRDGEQKGLGGIEKPANVLLEFEHA